MKFNTLQESTNTSSVTRREFFSRCTLCAAGVTALSTLPVSSLFSATDDINTVKARVRLIFAHPDPTQPNWPNIGYDFAGHIRQVQQKLV